MTEAEPAQHVLARWLLTAEMRDAAGPEVLNDAVERVCQKLSRRLAAIITVVGYRALVGRALHLARADFPLLNMVRVASTDDSCFEGLAQHLPDTDFDAMQDALTAVLASIITLLDTFIGEDLVLRLLGDIWPDMPFGTVQHLREANG